MGRLLPDRWYDRTNLSLIEVVWDTTVAYFLLGLSAAVLFIGFRWKVIAIHGGSVDRDSEPFLFWVAMTIPALGLIASIVALLLGN